MKINYVISLAMIFWVSFSLAQEPKVKKVSFKTSAVCHDCKERIEQKLNYTKGVIYAELSVDTKILTVKYRTRALNSMQIKVLVSRIGYDAGEVPRNKESFEKLPKCCKSQGHCQH